MSDASPSDEALLSAARAGDRDALEALLERHEPQVYRFGMKMCGHPEDAKDVLQDTLFAMARNLRDFRGNSSISTWLYSIARSFCLKKRRRSKFAPETPRSLETGDGVDASKLADSAALADDALAGKQVERALERAIGELDPMYREVLLLRDVEGLTAPEVAEVLGVTVQAVKSRLHRARLSVRERVAPLLGIVPEPAAPGICPDVLTMFSACLEGEISADLCAQLEHHLESCGRCRGACESLKRVLTLCRTSGDSVAVPAAIQASVKSALHDCIAGTC